MRAYSISSAELRNPAACRAGVARRRHVAHAVLLTPSRWIMAIGHCMKWEQPNDALAQLSLVDDLSSLLVQSLPVCFPGPSPRQRRLADIFPEQAREVRLIG